MLNPIASVSNAKLAALLLPLVPVGADKAAAVEVIHADLMTVNPAHRAEANGGNEKIAPQLVRGVLNYLFDNYANVYKRRGLLRQQSCESCGADKTEMHHADYSKPLAVKWLCRPCHMALHRAQPRPDRRRARLATSSIDRSR